MAIPTKKRDGSLTPKEGYRDAGQTTVDPPIDPRRIISSDLMVSHVASSTDLAFLQTDRALALEADELERQHGIHVYSRMNDEPIVAGILFTAKVLTVGNGARIALSHKEPPEYGATLEQKRDWDQAQKYQEYGQEVIARLERVDESVCTTIYDQLNAFYQGHTLAEKERNYFASGPYRGKYCLQSLRVKPRENYTFILDEMNRFRGITAKIPGRTVIVWRGIIGDASWLQNAISPEKFVILTCDKQMGNPQGNSMYRAMWDPYRRKQLLKPEAVNTGKQFGGGMITVIGPENFVDVTVTDPDTNEQVNIMVAIQRQVSKLQNGGVAVLPFGCIVTVHQPKADPTFFDAQFERHDYEMYQRFFGSAEAFLPADSNSEANANTAQDTVAKAVQYFQRWVAAAWSRSVFQPLVEGSFGEDAVKYAPILELNPDGDVDFATNMTALAAGVSAGAIDKSQLTGFDKKFGNPPRDPNWQKNNQEQAEKVPDPENPKEDKSEAA